MIDYTVIFGNGGGVTIQTERYSHTYGIPADAARDVRALMLGDDTDDWDGNDEDAWIEPTAEQIRNGGYRVFSSADVDAMTEDEAADNSWGNVREFFAALKKEG